MFGRKLIPVARRMVAVAGALCLAAGVLPQSSVAKPRAISSAPQTTVAIEGSPMSEDEKVLHVLNRLTFGPRPGDVDDVKAMGVEKFIYMQLNPQEIPEPDSITSFLKNNEAINESPLEIFKVYGPPVIRLSFQKTGDKGEDKKDAQKQIAQNYRKLYLETAEARLRRAVESPRQLQEVMTEFWYNHFNVSSDKGLCHLWIGSYEESAIRPYALGKFRDLVVATSHHPAMLFYLDNWQNTKPEAAANPKGRFKGLNENFARELMELHTLGVDGGYTQQDVIELAKVLTGLGLPPQRRQMFLEAGSGQGHLMRSGAYFDPNRHDYSTKTLLGHTIRGTGEEEIDQAIDLLCREPATAHHISYQLAQYFVADNPPPALVDRLSRRFQQSDGDIKPVLTELFHSPEFWDRNYENAKFKNPYRYVVSSLRAANVALSDYKPVIGFFNQLGMPLYRCLTPDGYKTTQEAWLSPDSLLQRIQFATGLGAGKLPNNPLDPLDANDVQKAMESEFSQHTLDVVAAAPQPLKSALLLGSPEFMNY
jgi:uncharacterized protein (DUF1800 family)